MRLSLARLLGSLALLTLASLVPTAGRAQAAGSVCKDGTTTTAKGRGACGKHGGVDPAATKAARDAAKAARDSAKAARRAAKSAAAAHSKDRAKEAEPSLPRAKTSSSAAGRAHASTNATAGSGGKEDSNPAGAIAQCNDGLYSHAAHRRGACARHGGVKSWTGA